MGKISDIRTKLMGVIMTSEKTLPTVAILGGTGNEGPGLALRWADLGYRVIIGSRQKEKAEATADKLNGQLGIDTILGFENSEAAGARPGYRRRISGRLCYRSQGGREESQR